MPFFKNIFIVSIFALLTLLGYTQSARALEFDPIAAQTSLTFYDDAHIKNLFGILLQNAIIMGDIQAGRQTISQPPLQPAPSVTVIPPNPTTGSSGATLFSATDLSSQRFFTDTATIKNLSVTSCTGCSSGGGLSGLTSGKIPVATSSNSLGDSIIEQSGGNVGIGTNNLHARLGVSGGIKSNGFFESPTVLDTYWYGSPNDYKFGALLDLVPAASDFAKPDIEGLHINIKADPTAHYTGSVNGLTVFTVAGADSNTNVQNVNSGFFQTVKDGTGSTDYLQAGDFRAQMYNGTANYLWGLYVYIAPQGGTVANNSAGIYVDLPGSGATVASHYGLYMKDQRGVSPGKDYAIWYDSPGVWRLNGDGIVAYYNPTFSPQYTPGATNYERVVTQWNSNVAEIGTEASGTGTLRPLRLLGSSVLVPNNLGIGITNPTEPLDINSDNIRVRTSKTPATSGSTCDQGEISWDSGYVYVCTATNTWKRSALTTW